MDRLDGRRHHLVAQTANMDGVTVNTLRPQEARCGRPWWWPPRFGPRERRIGNPGLCCGTPSAFKKAHACDAGRGEEGDGARGDSLAPDESRAVVEGCEHDSLATDGGEDPALIEGFSEILGKVLGPHEHQ